jgi:murein DD-endopeptidase MepM/ murein hydrolase activator NlpD
MGKLRSLKLWLAFWVFGFCILNFIGCTTAPYVKPPVPAPPSKTAGIYHRVEKGQTLWRISKMYSVDLDEIAKINHIADTAKIEAGQLILIPNREKQQESVNYASDDFIWPVKGKVISGFGQTYAGMMNKGVNIRPDSNLDVVAARGGKVIFYNNDFAGLGKTIIIDHGDGLSTVYARNAQVFIKAGDYVQKGTLIAKAGCGGRDKDIYTHFEIRKGYIPQNPYYYLP